MINLKRMETYHQIWKHFNLKYTIEQIGETIELIEETQSFPGKGEECSYEIWQEYLVVQDNDQVRALNQMEEADWYSAYEIEYEMGISKETLTDLCNRGLVDAKADKSGFAMFSRKK